MTWTQTTLTIKDANGNNQPVISYTDGTNFSFAHPLLDNTGSIIAPATAGNQTTTNTSLATIATAIQAAIPAGANMIGAVTSPGTVHLTASPTVTAAAYASGQVVGGLISLSGAARVNSGSGTIQTAMVTVKTALTAPFDIFFFDTNPSNSTFTDNAALALNVADLPSLCGIAHCVDLVAAGTPQVLLASSLGIPFKLSAAATTLYAVIVMRGAETLASTSAIALSVIIYQD